MTPQEFVDAWRGTSLSERASYQLHFNAVCELVGHEKPGGSGTDAQGLTFVFEHSIKKDTGGQGFADVFYQGHFAIEYKAPGKYKDLSEAYQQLLKYREKLNNPPLLVVTDIEQWEIHTNWPNTEKRVYKFSHADIANRPSVLQYLRDMFDAPERLHPNRNTEEVTKDAAAVFEVIARHMRDAEADPQRIAHFLTKLVFCLFAEDVSLLPSYQGGERGIFSEIIEQTRSEPSRFQRYTADLFEAMNNGGDVLLQKIPYFNGALFDDVSVEEVPYEALLDLSKAARLNWESVEPAIFGTLFERSLDPSKRSQLGAHYTSREDILLIVEPVLMQPLRRQWEAIQEQARPIREKYDAALQGSNRRQITTYSNQLTALRQEMLDRLSSITVLDPACGSGNFLYVSLQLLMDMEKAVILSDLFAGMQQPFPAVHPRQMYGIEKDDIAHALASIVVWIGYLQWHQHNGYTHYDDPILADLSDQIVNRDAILEYDAAGQPREPDWPAVDVIVSNPPFLGSRKLRPELGDEYVNNIIKVYHDGFGDLTPDLVCYWFEKGLRHLRSGKVKRAGMLATNSIRGGTNRNILDRIVDQDQIFMAWSDREWILEGAAVRVSMVGFDDGEEDEIVLDGVRAQKINPDLTSVTDITISKPLTENQNISFQGIVKRGPFDMPEADAMRMIEADASNRDVLKPISNGLDITRRSRKKWIVDFGVDTPIDEAKKYELPFQHVETYVQPMRQETKQALSQEIWWLHWNPRPAMRKALDGLRRYIATPTVAKHRLFVWFEYSIHPDHQLIVFPRDDDYFFGVLHSMLHEVWSLRMGTSLEDRPRYTPTTTFETFPFPWPPGQEETSSPHYAAISAAAKQLHEERDAWLNPAGASEKTLKDRTLTNLYNALQELRGDSSVRIKPDAADFAPRLDQLHRALDRAVCDAYGWDDLGDTDYVFNLYTPEGQEEILRRLLALNLERAG